MEAAFGKWLTIEEYAKLRGLDEARAREEILAGEALTKRVAGREYVWAEDASAEAAGAESGESLAGAAGHSLVSRLPLSQELALQTERAISLVERSLSAFMLMHQEVVQEKDRSSERHGDALREKDLEIEGREEKIAELTRNLQEKEQEIADLKMLVGILEKRVSRPVATPTEPLDAPERATVGDLMEDQLRYIMEEQMVKDLLKS